MTDTNLIYEAVKTAIKKGEATVNLKEASALTGSGAGVGGRTIYDDAFFALRMANPIRALSRVITTTGAQEAFVAKIGNATNIQNGSVNPWGYGINNDVGTPNIATVFWQQDVKSINAVVPIRTAVMDDINGLDPAITGDIALEFAQQEALSMMLNNDQSGTTTVQTGGVYGLRGLNSYAGSTSAASWGTSGYGYGNGYHTMLQVSATTSGSVVYNDIAALASALPSQYWNLPSTAWMMHPTTIAALRDLKDSGGLPLFLEIGSKDGYSIGNIFGHPVIPNPYMNQLGSGGYPIYLAAWDRFVTIADNEEMSIKRLEQYAPGFVTLFCEKRVVSTIRDVYAGVRLAD